VLGNKSQQEVEGSGEIGQPHFESRFGIAGFGEWLGNVGHASG
jgi:hypothetical protein